MFLDLFLLYIKEFVGLIGVLVIIRGSVCSLYNWFIKKLNTNYIRWELGNSIILGLEFIVGADIIGSLVRPDYYSIGLLASVVIIRIILSYFLNLELNALTPQQQQQVFHK